ncbi:hypothetical protein AN958_05784 [Leucoagaricus sp. SymC.cos]|nr:hypothetical protein AN958_05784 [Leucoagaricus sp. SymC.cos]
MFLKNAFEYESRKQIGSKGSGDTGLCLIKEGIYTTPSRGVSYVESSSLLEGSGSITTLYIS